MLVGDGWLSGDSGRLNGPDLRRGFLHRRTFRIRGRNSCEECLTGEEQIIKIAPPPTTALTGGRSNSANHEQKTQASRFNVSRNTCVFCFTVYEKNANPILPMSCAISMMTTRLPILNNQAFTMPSALHKPRRMPPGSG